MRRNALLALVVWACTSPALAQTTDPAADPAATPASTGVSEERAAQIEARLNALEQNAGGDTAGGDTAQELADIRQELEDLRADTEDQSNSILEDLANRVTVSGYMHSWLRASRSEHLHFRAWRANIIINAQITSTLSFFAEWEFEDAAAIGGGKGVLETERAYMQLGLWPALGIRAGILLVPFSNFNLLHEGWRHAFSTPPLINKNIFPSTYADVGLEAYGTLVNRDSLQLTYELMVSNGLTNDIQTVAGGGTGLRHARPSFGHDNNRGKSTTLRVGLAAGDHVQLGVSGHYGAFADRGGAALAMAGADMTLTYDSFVARAEGLYIYLPVASRTFDDDGDPSTPEITSRLIEGGGGAVLDLEYRFFPSFMSGTPFGSFEDPKFFLAVRGDGGFVSFPGRTNHEYRVTGSFGYRPVEQSAIRFEYLRSFTPDTGGAGVERGNSWTATVSFAMSY